MTNKDIFTAVILGGILFITGQYIASQPQRIEQAVEANRELTVTGTGEVTARPDVARISLGVQTGLHQNAEDALEELGAKFDKIVETISNEGISEEDIKTSNLSINPRYDFENGRQILRGFEASESVQVTIRDLDATGRIVALATQQGVNQAGGISFEIDDPRELSLQAQEQGIAQARKSAEKLAKALGADLGKVKSFSAQSEGQGPIPLSYARGGDAELAEAIAAPPINPGSQDIRSIVTITYELR